MGSDAFILMTELPIEEGLSPDWQAARSALAAMSDEQLEDLAEVLYAPDLDATGLDVCAAAEVRAALSGVIDRVEAAIS